MFMLSLKGTSFLMDIFTILFLLQWHGVFFFVGYLDDHVSDQVGGSWRSLGDGPHNVAVRMILGSHATFECYNGIGH